MSFYGPSAAAESKPERITDTVIDYDIRCVCNKLLAEMCARPWRIKCPRCKQTVQSPDDIH